MHSQPASLRFIDNPFDDFTIVVTNENFIDEIRAHNCPQVCNGAEYHPRFQIAQLPFGGIEDAFEHITKLRIFFQLVMQYLRLVSMANNHHIAAVHSEARPQAEAIDAAPPDQHKETAHHRKNNDEAGNEV